MDLTDHVIVVTGASKGIGRDTSILLSQLGARVILVSRDKKKLEETLTLLDGENHCVEPFDLGVADEIPSWLKVLSAKYGQIRGVAHCAGKQAIQTLGIVKSADIEEIMKINVTSAIMIAKGFRQKGVHAPNASIVFVSSVTGLVGTAGRSAYCASKGALNSLARSLALELVRDGIRVNCVAPAFVRTEMLQDAQAVLSSDELERIRAQHPLGFGDPRDVSHCIAFLLAGTGRWITGSTLVVDGGFTAQ